MRDRAKKFISWLLTFAILAVSLPATSLTALADGADTTAPTIADVSPNNASEYANTLRIPYTIGAHVDGSMEITFSEAMDTQASGTVTLDNSGGTLAASGGSWSSDGTVYTIDYAGLSYGTKYTATISGFKDAAGNTMADDATHHFTTATDAIYDTTAYYFTNNGLYHRDLTVYSAKSGSKLTGITVKDSGGNVTSADYSTSEGGMAITIPQAYLATLASGTYTLTYAFDGTDTDTVALTVEPNYNYNAAAGTIWNSTLLPTTGSGYTNNLTLPLTSGKTLSSVNLQYLNVRTLHPGLTKSKAAVEVGSSHYTVNSNNTVTFDKTFPAGGVKSGIENLTLNYSDGTSDLAAVTVGENLDTSYYKYEFSDRNQMETYFGGYEPNMTMDADGNTYITDFANYRILEIAGEDGTQWGIDMTAGQTYVVYTAPASSTGVLFPERITTDSEGNLYFLSCGVYSMMVKKSGAYFGMQLTKGQTVDLLSDSYSTNNSMMSTAIDNSGNLIIGGVNWIHGSPDQESYMIVYPRKSGTYYGQSMVTGKAYALIGTNSGRPLAITVDASGNIYYATGQYNYTSNGGTVWMIPAKDGTYFGIAMTANTPCKIAGDISNPGYTGDGANALSARLQSLYGIAVDAQGNVYVSDIKDHVVREIAAKSGTQWGRSTVTGYIDSIVNGTVDISMFSSADSICARKVDGVQHIYILDTTAGKVVDAYQQVDLPEYTLSYDANGGTGAPPNVGYYAGTKVFEELPSFNSTVYRDGYSFAGWSTVKDGGESVGGTYVMPAANTTLYARWVPTTGTVLTQGIARCADKYGNIFYYDSTVNNHGIYMKPAKSGTYFGQQLTAGTWAKIVAVDGGIPTQMFTDDMDNIYYYLDELNLYMVPEKSGTYFGKQMTTGTINTIAGNGKEATITSGVDATKMDCAIMTATVDDKQNVYISNTDTNLSGDYIMMIPNKPGTYFGQSMQAGYGYIIAGNGTATLDSDTELYTPESCLGGLATDAPLHPSSLTVDSLGNLFYADLRAIYMIPAVGGTYFGQTMEAEHVYHVGGKGISESEDSDDYKLTFIRSDRFDGVEGPATEAIFENTKMTCDKDGNLYFTNTSPSAFPQELTIHMIPVNDGTHWGAAMKAGSIYSVPAPNVFALYGYSSDEDNMYVTYCTALNFDAAGNLQVFFRGKGQTAGSFIEFKIGDATQDISLGSQTGTLTAGTAGSAIFTATTAHIDDGAAATVSWCDASGNALASPPTGLTATANDVSSNVSKVTVTADTTAAAGTFYFTLNSGIGTSAVTSVAVKAPSTVSSVSVTPSTASVDKGGSKTFAATVLGTNDPDTTVTWSVNGNSTGTKIDSNGKLTVGANETAATLTVTATSTVDGSTSGTATVTVTTPTPTVSTVTVSPSSADVQQGDSKTFGATVDGTNNPAQTVTWKVSGNNSANTKINTSGVLTVGANETAATLTVTATSTVDGTTSGTATVTVTTAPPPTPTVDTVTVNPSTVTINTGDNYTFGATVAGSNSPDQTVTWSVSGKHSTGTAIGTDGKLTVGADETASTLTVTATSTVDTGKSDTATVTVNKVAPASPTINITESPFKSFLHFISFGLFFNNDLIHISISSASSNIDHYEYQKVASGDNYDADGTWTTADSFTISPEFKGTVYGRAVATNGAVSDVTVKALVVDQTKPTITATYSEANDKISVDVADSGAGIDTITYKVGGADAQTINLEPTETKDITTSNSFDITSLPNGKYNVTIDAVDNSGNTAATKTVAVVQGPIVEGVSVTPPTASVDKGGSKSFVATVVGENDPDTTVTWSVNGNSSDTKIGTDGKLTVGADETAATLTVTATSTEDNTQSGTATVTVTTPAPTVSSVTVSPSSADVQQGDSKTFGATVSGSFSPAQTVTWTVSGNHSDDTKIGTDGKLTVGANETAATLMVTATSTVDGTTSGTATVTVTTAPPPTPTVDTVTVNPSTVTVKTGDNYTFGATVAGTNSPDQTVTWSVSGKHSSDTAIGTNGKLTVGADETASTLTVTATSTVDNTKSDNATVTVNKVVPAAPTVTITENPFKSFLHFISFGLFFNDSLIHVSLSSTSANIDHYEYQTVAYGGSEGSTWTKEASFTISPEFKGSVHARAVATNGTVSDVTVKALVVDQTKPTISATYSAADSKIIVGVTDSGAGIGTITYKVGSADAQTINLEPTATKDITTSNSFDISSLPNGQYFVTIDAVDNAGNAADTKTIQIDRGATVTSVTVTPSTASVKKGDTQSFSAAVVGNYDPAQTVTWSVSGNNSTDTKINSSGVLTVGAGETASTLTVKATSTVNSAKSSTATVTVTSVAPPTPTVTSVSVTPPTATVLVGGTQTFSAAVTGSNSPDQTVTWSVSGNHSTNTVIGTDGKLSVGTNETADTLTVTATSTVDNTKSGTATVTVSKPRSLTGIEMKSLPKKINYVQGDSFDLTGAALSLKYSDNSTDTISPQSSMVSGFDSSKTGSEKITVTYQGKSTSFDVNIIPAVVSNTEKTATVNIAGADLPSGVTSVTVGGGVVANSGGNTTTYDSVNTLLTQNNAGFSIGGVNLLQIELLDQNGKPISGFGKVTVSLPIPEGMSGDLHVYWYDPDTHALTDMNAKQINGFLVFETTHFSTYAVAQLKAEGTGNNTNTTTTTPTSNPKTGETSPSDWFMLAALPAAFGVALAVKKRRLRFKRKP